MAKKEYTVKGIPTKISATSRVAVKIKDNYYTIEASEERAFPADNSDELNMEEEYNALFDSVNSIVDNQMQDIITTFSKK